MHPIATIFTDITLKIFDNIRLENRRDPKKMVGKLILVIAL